MSADFDGAAVAAALAELETLAPGVFWQLAKGRLSASEPLYGFHALFGATDILAEGEGATPEAAILAAAGALRARAFRLRPRA